MSEYKWLEVFSFIFENENDSADYVYLEVVYCLFNSGILLESGKPLKVYDLFRKYFVFCDVVVLCTAEDYFDFIEASADYADNDHLEVVNFSITKNFFF